MQIEKLNSARVLFGILKSPVGWIRFGSSIHSVGTIIVGVFHNTLLLVIAQFAGVKKLIILSKGTVESAGNGD
ncbi:MAG: hypothetical protein D8M57_07750 [Candidatus Scalindua sp. AMX11]|nr:MAG: hypothetical protein DWQ00_11350 [Candidatus Scalindua sp.]NOG85268.1 hypothetical protein [Planctomycetota bacterium]RZV81513.1 MAG: hypothetical protein EX341_10380 [Candidatus Scalindua sp. SCAELEC01]TDE65414.1 MAG: hypothetical protein D8M57_07750 [Candidatus Scalindua sp. AMX11]GJQ59336.1 MAG: hypothetical protein SCALA701_21370 [Candidatus Scalindua sp.]